MNILVYYNLTIAVILWFIASRILIGGNPKGSLVYSMGGWMFFLGATLGDFLMTNGAVFKGLLNASAGTSTLILGATIVALSIGGLAPIVVNSVTKSSKSEEDQINEYSYGLINVLVKTKEIVTKLGNNYMGTEHLTLALIETNWFTEGVLAQLHLDVKEAVAYLNGEIHKADVPMTSHHIRRTPRYKRVLTLAYVISKQRKEKQVTPEHVILGILRDGDGIGYQALARQGLTYDNVSKLIS